jgi:hypothetical protein
MYTTPSGKTDQTMFAPRWRLTDKHQRKHTLLRDGTRKGPQQNKETFRMKTGFSFLSVTQTVRELAKLKRTNHDFIVL